MRSIRAPIILFGLLLAWSVGLPQTGERDIRERNLKAIWKALDDFAFENNDKLPGKLSILHYRGYSSDLSIFQMPGSEPLKYPAEIDSKGAFVLLAVELKKSPKTPLVREKKSPGDTGGVLTLFSDGSIAPEPGESQLPGQDDPSDEKKDEVVHQEGEVICKAGDVCREQKTGLPLRVLPRPFSHVYAGAEDGATVEDNVPAFHPFYVVQRKDVDFSNIKEPAGWYEVAREVGQKPLGWMKAKDVLEWRQALIVAYTHHGTGDEERQRVLMFGKLKDLQNIVKSENMGDRARTLYGQLKRNELPDAVVSKEPEAFVDIAKTFYVMPVVTFEKVELLGEAATYLQIAAAVPGARGADTLDDPMKRRELTQPEKLERKSSKALGVDLVFVMDMTSSMQPYMDRTKEALAGLARSFTAKYADDPELKDKIRFGLVGYRDDARKVPAWEFTSKNFTPELVDAGGLADVLENEATASIVGSRDHPEEVFAGIKDALDSTKWRNDTLKMIVLVGDASSHPVGHPQNTTGLDARALRQLAGDRQVHVIGIHLKDPKHSVDHRVAETQFRELTRVEGTAHKNALVTVDTGDPDSFRNTMNPLVEAVAARLSRLRQRESPVEPADPADRDGRVVKAIVEDTLGAALVEYLGKEAKPPKDIVAWVVDRDLTEPAVRALEIRVLVNREQLSDLVLALGTILKALGNAEVTQRQFFDALQAVAAQTEKDPARITKAQKLKDAGLLPAFVNSLPYKSEILELTDAKFDGMTAEQRSGLEARLKAKLQQYRVVNEQADGWVKLNEQDERTKMVYPLELDALP